MRIVVVGSSNTDLVIHTSHLPLPGETILGGDFHQFAGGKGANQAVASARAGAEVTFVGAHGADAFGAAAKRGLREEGVDVRYFREKRRHPSGVALIFVGGKSKENLIAVARSANDALTAADVRAAEPAIRRAQVVLAQLETPLASVLEAARLAQRHRVPFVLNPAPARMLPVSIFPLVHTLVPNEHEAEVLARGALSRVRFKRTLPARLTRKHPDLLRHGATLIQRGCSQIVTTLGADGAFIIQTSRDHSERRPRRSGNLRHCWISAPRVTPLDTVGAGDCFSAWLAVGLADGQSLEEAAARAVKAAAISVTRAGAQASMPHVREVH